MTGNPVPLFFHFKELTTQFDVNSLAFSPDGKFIAASGGGAPGIEVLELANKQTVASLLFSSAAATTNSLTWSNFGMIASINGVGSSVLSVWSDTTYEKIVDLQLTGEGRISNHTFCSTGLKLAVATNCSARDGANLFIYDTRDWSCEAIKVNDVWPKAVRWSDGLIWVVGNDDSIESGLTAVVVNESDYSDQHTFKAIDSKVRKICLSVESGGNRAVVSVDTMKSKSVNNTLFLVLEFTDGNAISIKSRHDYPSTSCTALEHLGDSGFITADIFDYSNAPLKIIAVDNFECVDVNLNTQRTSDGFATSKDGHFIALGIGNVVCVYTDSQDGSCAQ